LEKSVEKESALHNSDDEEAKDLVDVNEFKLTVQTNFNTLNPDSEPNSAASNSEYLMSPSSPTLNQKVQK